MGWGGKGKGKGWGPGWGHGHHHHHHHGLGPVGVAAEAIAIGATAGVVAATVARPRPRRRAPRRPAPVVIVGGVAQPAPAVAILQPAPAVAVVQQPPPVVVYPPPKGKGKGKGPVVIVQQQLPPLRVSMVRLPAESIEDRGGVTFYGVQVTPEGGAPWQVIRRYNDFHDLHSKLGPAAHSFPDAPFPGKHLFGCSGQKLEARRRGLEVWLWRAIQSPRSEGEWLKPLHDFLEAGRTLPPVPPYAPAPHASAPVPPASAATASPQTMSQEPAPAGVAEDDASDDDDDGSTLQIEIPAGITAGQLLGVTVPDGRQLTVPVPEGFAPGAKLDLWFDPTGDGSLTPLV